jgi:transposase-like protein
MVRHGGAIGSSAMPNGVSVAELCRKHGVSDATVYKWKAKFGGMDVSEAKRLKALEDENAKLKRLLAETMLDNVALCPSSNDLEQAA